MIASIYFVSISLANVPLLHMWPVLDAVSLKAIFPFNVKRLMEGEGKSENMEK